MARPKKIDPKPKSHVLSVRVPDADFVKVSALAVEQARPITSCCRYLIGVGLKHLEVVAKSRETDAA